MPSVVVATLYCENIRILLHNRVESLRGEFLIGIKQRVIHRAILLTLYRKTVEVRNAEDSLDLGIFVIRIFKAYVYLIILLGTVRD